MGVGKPHSGLYQACALEAREKGHGFRPMKRRLDLSTKQMLKEPDSQPTLSLLGPWERRSHHYHGDSPGALALSLVSLMLHSSLVVSVISPRFFLVSPSPCTSNLIRFCSTHLFRAIFLSVELIIPMCFFFPLLFVFSPFSG